MGTSATARIRSPSVPSAGRWRARREPRSRRSRRRRREPRSTLFRARRFLEVAATPAADRYGRLVEVFPLELRRRLWTDEALAHAAASLLPAAADLRLVDIESYLPGDLLPKADIASMAVSLELRSPFLDHRVVELGLALPPELARGKAALKQAFAADLPPSIAARGKTGFGVPLDRWFRNELGPLAVELLLGGRDRGLFRRPELELLLREHAARRADHGHRLWCLCMLELWQRNYVDAARPVQAPRDETPRLRVVIAACALPRLVAAPARARRAVLADGVEKSDTMAQVFLKSGTFGYVPGIPSASTQPLYGWFLIVVYWIGGRHWWSLGTVQIAVAVLTAVLVYEIGRRFISPRAGLIAAVVATLHPYLIWHDVHVNREILDQPLGAAMFLLALVAVKRIALRAPDRSRHRQWSRDAVELSPRRAPDRVRRLPALATHGLGRGGRRPGARSVVAISPWVVRNKVEVGCWALTDDGRALWKANNADTYGILAKGGWIDDVPDFAGRGRHVPPQWRTTTGGRHDLRRERHPRSTNECAQQAHYEHLVIQFWKQHPGTKVKLMAQATKMLWSPSVTADGGESSSSGGVGQIKSIVEPLYMIPLYLLALVGLFVVAAALPRCSRSRSSATRRWPPGCSPGRRAIACRGTSCWRCSPRRP